MPLPQDDDYIALKLNKKGKPVPATALDHIKILNIIGETVLDAVEKGEIIPTEMSEDELEKHLKDMDTEK